MVSPLWNSSYVFLSSMGISSGLITIPLVCSIYLIASLIKVKVFKPRKSILSSPASSATELSYCVQTRSESFAVATGTKFVKSSGVIITPHACMPVFRTEPSIALAFRRTSADLVSCLMSLRSSRALETSSWFFSLSIRRLSSISKSLFNEISGSIFANESASFKGKFITRAVSRIADLAAIVP